MVTVVTASLVEVDDFTSTSLFSLEAVGDGSSFNRHATHI